MDVHPCVGTEGSFLLGLSNPTQCPKVLVIVPKRLNQQWVLVAGSTKVFVCSFFFLFPALMSALGPIHLFFAFNIGSSVSGQHQDVCGHYQHILVRKMGRQGKKKKQAVPLYCLQ
jgi:hypothetical protein